MTDEPKPPPGVVARARSINTFSVWWRLYNRCPRWIYSQLIEGKPPHRKRHLLFGVKL